MVLALPLVLISKNVLLLTLLLPMALALPIKSELISDIGPGLLYELKECVSSNYYSLKNPCGKAHT